MDGDERLTALKKAYADIILNTAKEAAARIMVSERNAIRFEHELNVAKEQALQMLLRLKQTLDSKVTEAGMTYLRQQTKIDNLKAKLRDAEDTISEAESASLIQQRKIDELESQLQEAEDIVKDLREELREVQAELDRVRGNKLQRMGEHDIQDQTSQENILNTTQSVIYPSPESRLESFTTSDMKNSAFNQRNEVYKCYNENDFRMRNVRNPYIRKPDLPFASEESRLYNVQSMFPPLESQRGSFTTSDVKNLAFNQRNDINKFYSANDSCMENSYVSKPNLPSIILRSKEPQPNRNRRTQRIRAFEEKLMAGELDVNYETSGKEDGEGEEICQTPPHKADDSTGKKDLVEADSGCYQVQKVKAKKVKYIRRKRRGAARCKNNKTSSSRHLSDQSCRKHQTCDISCTEVNSVDNNIQSGGEPSNMTPRLSAADTIGQGIPLGCAEVTESDAGFDKAVSTENIADKDKVLVDEFSLTRQESGSADRPRVPICRLDVEKVDVPVVNSPTETYRTPNGIPNQPAARVIKYTFQRKRKRESLISNCGGNASLENGIVKKKAAEKQNIPPEIENSSSIMESSRGSRRLAQVARQLISLSEKKWW